MLVALLSKPAEEVLVPFDIVLLLLSWKETLGWNKTELSVSNLYSILKLKVGGRNDRENLAALREVAPKKTVRVDANEAWKTPDEALKQIEWLAKDAYPDANLLTQITGVGSLTAVAFMATIGDGGRR